MDNGTTIYGVFEMILNYDFEKHLHELSSVTLGEIASALFAEPLIVGLVAGFMLARLFAVFQYTRRFEALQRSVEPTPERVVQHYPGPRIND